MIDSIYRISLDINEHGSQAVVKAKKTDTGRKLHITLRAGGMPYTIEDNCYAVFTATKPDGSILYNACTIEGNEIVYEFTEQTCTAVGRSPCEIKLYGLDDKLITSPRFALLVDGTVYPDGRVESTSEFSALTQMVSDGIKAIEAANKAADDANQAAKDAQTTEGRADEAAVRADDAAASANQAAQSANTASAAAGQAATAAQNAEQRASDAALDADDAATRANKATEAANGAANNANQAATKAAQTAKSLMVVGKAAGTAVHLDDAIEQFFVGCRIFGKTTQNGVPTPDAPVELVSVGENGRIGVTVSGKNLVNAIVNGTQSAAYAGALYCKLDCLEPNTEYAVSFVGAAGNKIYANENLFEFKEILCDGNRQYVTLKTQHNISKDRTDQYTEDRWIIFKNYASNTVVPNFKDVQIERGSTPTAYEPHKAQTCSVSTPNGLHGIPVTSGGNYTDANGQQWICDEIDFARGVLIKRVTTMTLVGDTSENIRFQNVNAHGIANFYISIESLPAKSFNLAKSNRLPLQRDMIADATTEGLHLAAPNGIYLRIASDRASDENPLKMVLQQWNAEGNALQICYALATPIEIPLSEEEIAAFDALHTYRDHTTVSNDASAHMELEYVMDARKYIDSMISTSGIIPATVE